ncbi:MAG: xanthine dehydrogenase family protein molybdopterin-binding subunit [Beijerinckiaceae bacterium]|nr:xanthine dehydrogenase family protein molybdopterin-binding subunit [Beijerinckiaceae bacterium]
MLHRTTSTFVNETPSRRGFLLGSAAVGSGLLIGFVSPKATLAGEVPLVPLKPVAPFSAYLKIGADNSVTVYSGQFDMGQGSYNGVATLLAEELGCDWSGIKVVGAASNVPAYGNLTQGGALQITGGSTSMATSFDRYRVAGATAREMLKQAAAEAWKVAASEIKVEKGVLSHASGKSAPFGEFAAKAAALAPPANVKLKDPKDWTLIGNDTLKRFDSTEKTNGTQDYTIDVKLPGMLTAVPIHPPLFGATVKSFDAGKAKAIKGVVDVVPMGRGLAVVADHMWSALKAREQVSVVWDDSKADKRSSPDLVSEYRDLAKKPGAAVARNDGDVEAALKSAVKVVEATFEFPYLAHAALEPLNAVARMNDNGTLEIWGGHQLPDIYQAVAAQIAGITPDKVIMHVMKTGGGFGRRAVMDADIIAEVVATAKALNFKAPVKMQWTREDDMRGGRYRPMYVHAMKAGLDKDGKIIAWKDTIVGQSIIGDTILAPMLVQNGVDATSVEGSANLPYAIPNLRVDLTTTKVGATVLWWRAVGSTHTAYCAEVFMDELAEAAGKDPIDYRLSMLQAHPRHAGVLKLAAEKAGWSKPAAPGRFRGVAVAEAFNSYVAHIVEISLDKGEIKVERVVCAVDCGVPINPDIIRQQMEGGIGFGIGAVMKSQITLDKGQVVEGNFDGYDVLRINEMPAVEVHIVPSREHPSGVGEPGVAPIGPALANAVYAATRKRMRVLPFTRPENA